MSLSKISIGNWLNINTNNFSKYRSIIEYAYKNNINTFDTASSYNFGEESLGYAIKNIDRKKIILSTKYYNVEDNNFEKGISPSYLKKYIHESLEKISTKYLDIIFIHNFTKEIKIEPIMESINSFYNSGKIKNWGICRWPKESINEAYEISKKKNYIPPKYYQGVFNLFNLKEDQINFLSFLNKKNIRLLGYSPLARGVLTNKYIKSIPNDSRAKDKEKLKFMYDFTSENIELIDSLKPLAERYRCTVTQLVFSFLLSYNLDSIITGVRSTDQLDEIINSEKISLDLKTKNTIKKKFNIYG